jgi:hypothetical protein
MDGDHFDTLIRSITSKRSRRGLLTAICGGLTGVLPTAFETDEALAKANHKREAAGATCRKLKQSCKRGKKFRCCDKVNPLHCDTVGFASGFRCCYDYQQVCSGASGECCRDLRCGSVPALAGQRCCGEPGVACATGDDCCDGVACTGGFCGNPMPLLPSPPPPMTPPPPSCLLNGQPCPAGCGQATSCTGCCSGYCNANLTCDAIP